MVVVCGFAGNGLKPEARNAIDNYAPMAEFLDFTGDEFAYYSAVNERWTGDEDLVLLEQDMIITADVIPSFESCNAPWCSFSYECFVAKPQAHVGQLTIGLGCTKFSAELQRNNPLPLNPVRWPDLDSAIVTPLIYNSALEPHVHGSINHLHNYVSARNLFRAFGLWDE